MADVWLAEDQELGRRVAVKILHERYASDDQFVERFRREATHAAGLSHPNIVSIYDRGEADGCYFIVMEYVEGRTLKELIVTRGPCPIPIGISYTRQILAALRYAHRNGIIHRDIKPHNVIVDREGRVKVADFGIARAGASQITEAGSIVGTAQYLSPEQARGAPVDESSDLYSSGIVLYELLTGTVPFTGETPVEIAMKHLSQAPAAPSAERAEIPRDIDLVVLRALAKEPTDRYRSAQEMDRDLELVARGEEVGEETADAATVVLRGGGALAVSEAEITAATGVAGRPPGSDERYRAYDAPVARRRPWWPWLLALLLAAGLAVAGYFLYENVRDQIDASQPIAVEDYEGIPEARAVTRIEADGFEAKVQRRPSASEPEGIVYEQSPDPGTRLARDSIVTILVSDGKPNVTVPDVRGDAQAEATEELVRRGLDPSVSFINSPEPEGTVTGQDPAPGLTVVTGTTVRINVSRGPKPVGVPSVIGLPYEQAAAQLQAQGFAVRRGPDIESDQPKGYVADQNPPGNATAPKNSPVTVTVSSGPATEEVPDVTDSDVATARATLQAAGFKVSVTVQDTEDPAREGVVISQDPAGGIPAEPGTVVNLFVGRYVAPPTEAPTTEAPPPTESLPTETTEVVPPVEPPPPPP